MVQSPIRFTSIEDYAALDPADLPAGNYELINGAIVEMGAESDVNLEIASFLFSCLLQFVPYYLLRRGTEVAVSSQSVTSRYPDLVVLTEETRHAMQREKRSLIGLDIPAPRLVIEVVSPGSENRDRDYIQKRQEYAVRGIPEYWLIDPERSLVAVLQLKDGRYQETQFRGADPVRSGTFPGLQVMAQQILDAN